MRATRTYRSLDPDKVVETIGQLRQRIVERFPGAGLGEVCAELLLLAGENSARAEKIARRNIPLRIAIFVLLAGGNCRAGVDRAAVHVLSDSGRQCLQRAAGRGRRPPT